MVNDKGFEKNSYVMYKAWSYMILPMSNENAGILFKAICNYQLGQQAHIDDDSLGGMFEMMKASFALDDAKYRDKCIKNSENGRKGGRPKKRTEANESERFLEKAKKADMDTDTDMDIDTDNDNDTDTDKEKETDTETDTDKGTVSSASASASVSFPSECGLLEICLREHIDCSAFDASNYWVEMKHKGWKDSNGNPIKSIGAHFRNWLKRNKRVGEPHFTESEKWKNYLEYKQMREEDAAIATADSFPANVPKTEEELMEICKREHIKCNGTDVEYYFFDMQRAGWKDAAGDPIRNVGAHFRDWLKRNADTTVAFCIDQSTYNLILTKSDLFGRIIDRLIKDDIDICTSDNKEMLHTADEFIELLQEKGLTEEASQVEDMLDADEGWGYK